MKTTTPDSIISICKHIGYCLNTMEDYSRYTFFSISHEYLQIFVSRIKFHSCFRRHSGAFRHSHKRLVICTSQKRVLWSVEFVCLGSTLSIQKCSRGVNLLSNFTTHGLDNGMWTTVTAEHCQQCQCLTLTSMMILEYLQSLMGPDEDFWGTWD